MNFIFSRLPIFGIAFLPLTTFCHTPFVHAQSSTNAAPATIASPIESGAQQLMAQTFRSYRALNSYSSMVAWQESGVPGTEGGSGGVTWQKPGRISVQTQVGSGNKASSQLNIFDGAKFISARTRDNRTRYISEKTADAALGVAQALETIDVSGIGLSAFLRGRSPLQVMGEQIQRASTRKASTEDANGLDESAEELDVVHVVLTPRENGAAPVDMTVSFVIARADSLLRRVRVRIGAGTKATSLTETYRKVRVNPDLNALTFTYAPPLEARRVAAFASGYDDRLEIGAVPFAITATDTKGKKLSLAEYKNRVLLLDFWATWCPPCREEMPNVIATYKKHNRRGFDIVGVSLDQNKGALQSYLAQNKMTWRQIFDGKGWGSTIAAQYGVTAIPFTLLIGRDGKIAAINPRGPQLEIAVKAALAKKSGA